MIGQTLSHYKIQGKLGSGGMGDVYIAEDTTLSRKVALKVLPPEMATEERRSRFEREAKAVAALNHPNIVHVYSVEETEGARSISPSETWKPISGFSS
jgi:serine/threonine protein kinase